MPRGVPKEPRECLRCGQPFQVRCGYQKYCPPCQEPAQRERKRFYSRVYYRSHREQCIQTVRRSQERNPEWYERYLRLKREYEARKLERVVPLVIHHYSGGTFRCACCGESQRDFLTIDHVDGNAYKTSEALGIPRGGSELYRWLVRRGFPPGYAVLCMNCNVSKGKHGICAHKLRIQSVKHSVEKTSA